MNELNSTESRTNIRLTRWIRAHLRNGRIVRKRFKDAMDSGKRNYVRACTAFDWLPPHTIFRCNQGNGAKSLLDETTIKGKRDHTKKCLPRFLSFSFIRQEVFNGFYAFSNRFLHYLSQYFRVEFDYRNPFLSVTLITSSLHNTKWYDIFRNDFYLLKNNKYVKVALRPIHIVLYCRNIRELLKCNRIPARHVVCASTAAWFLRFPFILANAISTWRPSFFFNFAIRLANVSFQFSVFAERFVKRSNS